FTTRPHGFLFPRRVVELTGEWSTELKVSYDWDFILRALEHAEVRGTEEPVTYYRKHPTSATASAIEGERGARYVVDNYFRRHPERRGTARERQARARMLALIGRTWATHGHRRKGLRILGRAGVEAPRAIWVEFRQALPAAAGRARQRLGRRPSSPTAAG